MQARYIPTVFIPLLVLFLCIIIAAVLGYFLFLGIDGKLDLDKIISKGALIFLLLCTFPARRLLKLSWTELGFCEKKVFIQQIGRGFIGGFCILLPVLICFYWLGILVIDEGKDWSMFYIGKSLLVAFFLSLLISFAEEPLFRGVLLTAYARKMGLFAGICVSSFYYAILHFTKTSKELALHEATLGKTFGLVADALMNVINPENYSALLSLLMVGIFLSIMREKMQLGMGICIGYHTGWVVLIKMTRKFFNNDWQVDYAWFASHYDGVIGPFVTVWLMLAIVLLLVYSASAGKFSGQVD